MYFSSSNRSLFLYPLLDSASRASSLSPLVDARSLDRTPLFAIYSTLLSPPPWTSPEYRVIYTEVATLVLSLVVLDPPPSRSLPIRPASLPSLKVPKPDPLVKGLKGGGLH